jgi:hypothetical protein
VEELAEDMNELEESVCEVKKGLGDPNRRVTKVCTFMVGYLENAITKDEVVYCFCSVLLACLYYGHMLIRFGTVHRAPERDPPLLTWWDGVTVLLSSVHLMEYWGYLR